MSKLIVIGGSVGAIDSLKIILPMLPREFPAAILIVIHIGSTRSILPDILARSSAMPVRHAIDGEPVVPGHVLVAPPDRHLTVIEVGASAYVRLHQGPKENHSRPAIDPLFRSGAAVFGANTIGVLLSGYLDDGTIGMQAVKACGGLCLAQDPHEAEAPDMLVSALRYVDIDRVLSCQEIGPALVELAGHDVPLANRDDYGADVAIPGWINIENSISSSDSDMDDLDHIGKPSALTCPECQGGLWEVHGAGPLRYRCHTGHAFTSGILGVLQGSVVEEAIWGAIRALHEQERLFMKLSEKELQSGYTNAADEFQASAAQAKAHSQALRDVIAVHAKLVKREHAQVPP